MNAHFYQYTAEILQHFDASDKHSLKKLVESLQVSPKTENFWIDYTQYPTIDELELFVEELQLNRFILEDIPDTYSRSKLEDFEKFLYFKINLPKVDQSSIIVSDRKCAFIIGKNYLFSLQEKPSKIFEPIQNRLNNKVGRIRQKSIDYLLVVLLDTIIDEYMDFMDYIAEEVDQLDNLILSQTTVSTKSRELLRKIETLNRKLIHLRKAIVPMRDICNQIQQLQSPLIKRENRSQFSRLQDSIKWIIEEIDGHKQVLDGLTNICFSINDQKMNEIMKVLTMVSVIFIPITFIVGVYGMNFQYMPELNQKYGYFVVWLVIISVAGGMTYYFRKKGWFKN